MAFIPLDCPSCGAGISIDPDESAAICSKCGKPFVVKDAIVLNYIKIVSGKDNESTKDLTNEDFIIEGDVLKRYNGTSSCVDVPDNVTVIGSKAFEDCKDIKEIRISDSVLEIEDNAFAGCDNLRAIVFPSSLKKIGRYAFSECSCLKTADLPKTIEEIGSYAFSGCFMLDLVKMPSSNANIHETAFMGDKEVQFDWPEDWSGKQLDKLKIIAPTQGGLLNLCGTDGSSDDGTYLYMGISDLGMYVESNKYNFYTYRGFMNLFSLEKNNDDPYLLRVSVENGRQMYDAIADIQKSYSELIGLLDRADISRSLIEMINIPHFIWKQGRRLTDYKVMDTGVVPALQIRLTRE